jgi:hypothetical protein
VRDFSATTTASTGSSSGALGTPMVWTTRMPARTRLFARSVGTGEIVGDAAQQHGVRV